MRRLSGGHKPHPTFWCPAAWPSNEPQRYTTKEAALFKALAITFLCLALGGGVAGFVGNARLAWGLEDSVDAMLYELAARVDDFEATLGSINAVVFEPEPTEAECTGENGGRYGDDGFTWIPMACDLDAASDGTADCPEGCDSVAAGWTTEATLSEAQLSAVADLRCLVGRSQQAVRANGPQVFGARALAVHLICGVPILVAILGVVAAVISSPKLSCFVTGAWLSWLLIVVWLSFGLHAYLAVIFGDLCMELDLTLSATAVFHFSPTATFVRPNI